MTDESAPRPYATPQAMRRAVTDRLRNLAAPHSPWPLSQLQRQFAYDRLLARLYAHDDRWILKGASALLARDIGVRMTVDLDVYLEATRDVAERAMRDAAAVDLGDWFSFELGPSLPVADGVAGVRIPATVSLGASVWTSFHVDVVAEGVQMTGEPDDVPSLVDIGIPGLSGANYRAYPLVDHIADKTLAVLQRYGDEARPSTRYKDLVDLVVLIGTVHVSADAQLGALRSEAKRRGVALPGRFDVPDLALWESGYRAEARRAVAGIPTTLDGALAAVRPFLDPLLKGDACDAWRPDQRRWVNLDNEP